MDVGVAASDYGAKTKKLVKNPSTDKWIKGVVEPNPHSEAGSRSAIATR